MPTCSHIICIKVDVDLPCDPNVEIRLVMEKCLCEQTPKLHAIQKSNCKLLLEFFSFTTYATDFSFPHQLEPRALLLIRKTNFN